MIRSNVIRRIAQTGIVLAAVGTSLAVPTMAQAVSTPAIRISASNQMPACVTTERLDLFLSDQIRKRGYRLSPAHRNIAKWYRKHGETHRVRWDYAFFQMALETNFLSFRRGNGKRGDVHPRQNNFAGLGTTGGGVPGDSYPNASIGVLAQIQHLVVYSGERLARPVGHRTRLKQNVILQSTKKIVRRRPMRFADLAGRWAADKRYGRSIKRLANLFYSEHCRSTEGRRPSAALAPAPFRPPPRQTDRTRKSARTDKTTAAPFLAENKARTSKRASSASKREIRDQSKTYATASATRLRAPRSTKTPEIPASRGLPKPPMKAAGAKSCSVQVASYGGTRAVLIESVTAGAVHLTALNVQPGFEDMMTQNFIQSHAPSGKPLGTFDNRAAAVAKARALCRKRTAETAK